MAAGMLNFEVTDSPTDNGHKDPTPGETPKRRGRPPGSGSKPRLETQAREELTMVLKFTAMFWSVRDPVCGGALNQVAADVAGDVAKFAAKSKWAAKWLEKAVGVGEIVPFFLHIQPLFTAIYAHHVAPAIERRTGVPMDEENAHAGFGPLG
jgi:hypothetical protein